MNDNNSSDVSVQVRNDVITPLATSPSSPSTAHLDQWLLVQVSQRQHAAVDRLNKLACDCTFCVPDTSVQTSFRLPIATTTTSNTTTVSTTTTTTTTTNKPVFSCGSCARTFASEKYLNMHAALHRKSPGSSSRSTVTSLMLSAGAAAVKDKWTCEVCGKIFAHTSNYKNHIRTHSDDRPFVCHVCSIGFKERYHLKKHTLFKHTGELNEACRRCGKRFKDSTAVRAHERIHSDARPYTCQRCGKAFKTSECLWHHDHRSKTCGRPRRNVDRASMLSTACQTSTPTADSLASLADLVDQSYSDASSHAAIDMKSFQGVRCRDSQQLAVKTEDAAFMLNNNDIKTDVMTPAVSASVALPWMSHSSKPVAVVIGQHVTGSGGIKQRSICSRCGKQFASSLAFERHLAVHSLSRPYRCHICDVGFKLKVHLKKHNLYRHNSDYPCRCRVCGKPFKDSSAVRLHERIHSSARPFQCACGKSFKTRENLWGHRHRRPCVGRYTACTVVSPEAQTPSAVSDRSHDAAAAIASSTFDTRAACNDSTALVACTDADSLMMFDSRDYMNADSKLLPPFETFIPPLRTPETATASLVRYPQYTDWTGASHVAGQGHDVVTSWWSSGAGNYQPLAPDMMTILSDVTDDWTCDWQLSRKLSM